MEVVYVFLFLQVISRDEILRDQYSVADTWRERIYLYKLRSSLPGHSLSRCFAISTVTVLGVFNRPTFLAFAFAPIFFWLQRGMGSKYIGFTDFNQRSFTLAVAAIPSTIFLIIIDSVYFGYLTFAEIMNKDVSLESNFVVTPYNFIKYNINPNNLAQHGLHSKLTHVLVNIPVLYNVLGLAGILAFFNIIVRYVIFIIGVVRLLSVYGGKITNSPPFVLVFLKFFLRIVVLVFI